MSAVEELQLRHSVPVRCRPQQGYSLMPLYPSDPAPDSSPFPPMLPYEILQPRYTVIVNDKQGHNCPPTGACRGDQPPASSPFPPMLAYAILQPRYTVLSSNKQVPVGSSKRVYPSDRVPTSPPFRLMLAYGMFQHRRTVLSANKYPRGSPLMLASLGDPSQNASRRRLILVN